MSRLHPAAVRSCVAVSQARGCSSKIPPTVDKRTQSMPGLTTSMATPQREFIWKEPYKPAQEAENAYSQVLPSVRRNSPSLSPRTESESSQKSETQFSFLFPRQIPQFRTTSRGSSPRLASQALFSPNMSGPTTINEAEKSKMIAALRNHSVNTLAELRRIERVFASIGTSDVTEPMTTAWQYYVNSHSLLTEMRSLTRNYPFNSDCLDEAKRRVLTDPNSNRSWNFCWLVLTKMQTDNLIPYYAHHQAALPAMWGNQLPAPEGVQALSAAFITEWSFALEQMLRHWEDPPVGRES